MPPAGPASPALHHATRIQKLAQLINRKKHMHTRDIAIGGKTLSIETGKLAKQADGSVIVRLGRHDGPGHRLRATPTRARASTSCR